MGSFTEKDIELVLFVLRNVGFALRKDDALALKDLIFEAQRKAGDIGAKFQDQTRVRYILVMKTKAKRITLYLNYLSFSRHS